MAYISEQIAKLWDSMLTWLAACIVNVYPSKVCVVWNACITEVQKQLAPNIDHIAQVRNDTLLAALVINSYSNKILWSMNGLHNWHAQMWDTTPIWIAPLHDDAL